jgi:hypothetical protein
MQWEGSDVVWKCWRASFLPTGMHRASYTCSELQFKLIFRLQVHWRRAQGEGCQRRSTRKCQRGLSKINYCNKSKSAVSAHSSGRRLSIVEPPSSLARGAPGPGAAAGPGPRVPHWQARIAPLLETGPGHCFGAKISGFQFISTKRFLPSPRLPNTVTASGPP